MYIKPVIVKSGTLKHPVPRIKRNKDASMRGVMIDASMRGVIIMVAQCSSGRQAQADAVSRLRARAVIATIRIKLLYSQNFS